jgi:hypothetical protein
VDLVLPVHVIGSTAILAGSDEVLRETVPPGTPVRLRLLNTDQQPRRFGLTGTPFRVVALDGVDLNGPTEVSGQALRVPAGGRYDLAFAMPAGPVRLLVEGPGRRAYAERCDWSPTRSLRRSVRSVDHQSHCRGHVVRLGPSRTRFDPACPEVALSASPLPMTGARAYGIQPCSSVRA